MKADIYESLYVINHSLQLVGEHLDRLKAAGILLPHMAELYRLSAQEISSTLNQTATLALHTREAEEAAQFQQQRVRLEEQMREMAPIRCATAKDAKDATEALPCLPTGYLPIG